MTEGKDPLSFSLYCKLAEYFLKPKDLFAHLYLILSWNLMCRTNNTSRINLSHIKWTNNSLQFYFGMMKNDQEGDTLKDARHVYANFTNPVICPVLALGMYLLVEHSIFLSRNDSNLFPGSRQASRFSKSLSRALKHLGVDDQVEIGIFQKKD
jgi:hypothetical protein